MFVKKKETREKYNKRDFVLHGNKRRRKVFFRIRKIRQNKT